MADRSTSALILGGASHLQTQAARVVAVLLVIIVLCAQDTGAQCTAGTGLGSSGTCIPCKSGFFCATDSFNVLGAVQGQTPVSTLSSANYPQDVAISPDGSFALVTASELSYRIGHLLRRIEIATGAIATLAGGGSGTNAAFADAVGTRASFNSPLGVAISPDGVFALVADTGNQRLRRIILATANVTTLAGGGSGTNGQFLDGIGTSALFSSPSGVAISPDGAFALVADKDNKCIRHVVISTGIVTTLAGNASSSGAGSMNGVDGLGTSASFAGPRSVAISSDGTFALVIDGSQVRRIAVSTGNVTTLVGGMSALSLPIGIAISPDGAFALVPERGRNHISRITISTGAITTIAGSASSTGSADGIGTSASFFYPQGVAISPSGTFALVGNEYYNSVRRFELAAPCQSGFYCPTGSSLATQLTCTPGFYCPNASSSPVPCNVTGFYCPSASSSQAPCSAGFYCNSTGLTASTSQAPCQARFYCPAGSSSSTQAGCNVPGFYCPSASSSATQVACSAGFYCSSTGLSSSASQAPCTSGFYCPSGSSSATQFACSVGFYCPAASSSLASQLPCRAGFYCPAGSSSPTQVPCLAGFSCDGSSFTVRGARDSQSFGSLLAGGTVTGSGSGMMPLSAAFADGTGALAFFFNPRNVAISPDGSFALVTESHHVRRIEIGTAVVTTLAGSRTGADSGTGTNGGFADGSGASASFNGPRGVAISSDGSFALVADEKNHRIRQISISTGIVSTLAGFFTASPTSTGGSFADGIGVNARFNSPTGVAIAPSGVFALVADSANSCIRRIVISSGLVTTLAGYYMESKTTDGTGQTAYFKSPIGVAISPDNSFALVADTAGQSVRHIVISTGTVTTLTSGLSVQSVTISPDGAFALATDHNSLMRISVGTGELTRLQSRIQFNNPFDVAFSPNGAFALLVDSQGVGSNLMNVQRVLRIDLAMPCNAGFYCPAGSSSQTQISCSAGYACNTTGLSTNAAQVICSSGYYCPASSSSSTQFQCSAGYYCPTGSSSAQQIPCPAGTYCPATGLSSPDSKVECETKYYCPAGSSQHVDCPAGSYCSSAGLSAPSGTCSGITCPAGKFLACPKLTSQPCAECPSGSICIPGISGSTQVCTAGNYCPPGALAPVVCPIGTFCPTSALDAPRLCTGGSYCSGTGLTAVSGSCSIGQVCTNGSSAPQPCPRGSICDQAGMATATPCPAGQFCTSVGLTTLAGAGTCAPGSYSTAGQQACSPCPSGLISSGNSAAVCSLCPSGKYPTTSTGASSCQSCTAGQACLLGSMPAPDTVTQPAASTPQSFNPFTATNVANKNSLTGTGVLISVIIFPIVALIIVLAIVAEKKPAFLRTLQTCGGRVSFDWSSLDLFFSEIHFAYLYLGKTTPIRKTSFGAAMSLACVGSILAVALILGVNNVRYPIYSSTIDPQTPPWQPLGEYKLSIRILGGGIEQCANFAIKSKPYDWSVTPSTPPNVYNAAEGSCSLSWQCSGSCIMMAASSATLTLKSAPRSWASYFSFSLNTPLPSSSTAPLSDFGSLPFQVASGSFPPPLAGMQNFTALQGTTATNVSITLTPFIVNGTNGQTQAVAFEPSVAGVEYGDTISRDTFNFVSNDGFTINFDLKRSPLAVVNAASTTAVVNFLVLLSSTVGTIIGAFQAIVKQMEKFLEFKPTDGADEMGHGGGGDIDKGASDKEPIELSAVSFSSKAPPIADTKISNIGDGTLEGRVAMIQQNQAQQQQQLQQHHAINQAILAELQSIKQHLQLSTPIQAAAAPASAPAPHHHEAATSGDGYGQMQDD